jgi:hypothetical protein
MLRLKWRARHMRNVAWLLRLMGVASAIVATIFVAKVLYFGSWSKAEASLKGNEITISPQAVDLGEIEAPGERTVSFTFTNVSRRTLKLLGASKSCSCTSFNTEFPVEVRPSEAVDVKFALNIQAENDSFDEGVRVYTNSAANPSFYLRVLARVRRSTPSPAKENMPLNVP